MFDTFTIRSREADIAYMEASNLIELSIDEGYITAFTEAGEGDKNSNIGSKIVDSVKNLAEKILKFFQDFIESAKAKLLVKKIKEDPTALENKKAEVLDLKKIMLFRKSYRNKIEKAKTVEEIDSIESEYEKKNKTAAVATVTVTLTTLGALIVNNKLQTSSDKLVNELNAECEKKFNDMSDYYCNNLGLDNFDYNVYEQKKSEYDKSCKKFSSFIKPDGKGHYIPKKTAVLQKFFTDDMKSVKDYFTSVVSAVSNGFKSNQK